MDTTEGPPNTEIQFVVIQYLVSIWPRAQKTDQAAILEILIQKLNEPNLFIQSVALLALNTIASLVCGAEKIRIINQLLLLRPFIIDANRILSTMLPTVVE